MNKEHPRLERTSPKGTPFLGHCPACGKDNLTLADMRQECQGEPITQEEALLSAIEPELD